MTRPTSSMKRRTTRRVADTILAAASVMVVGLVVGAAPALAAVTPSSGPESGGTPLMVDVPVFTAVDLGDNHSVAVASDGSVWAWGDNEYGGLGDGTTVDSVVAVEVDGTAWGSRTIVDVAAGIYHSVAVAGDGTVWAWGSNVTGQLGNGSSIDSLVPVQVDSTAWGARVIESVTAGAYHSVAVASDGTVWAWGSHAFGQLGNGGTAAPLVPTQVLSSAWGDRHISQVATGVSHSVALADDGSVWAWGYNAYGQRGDGLTISALDDPPVPVDPAAWGSRTFIAVAADSYSSYAVASDGTVWSWGYNASGQLGDGTAADTATPVQVDPSAWGDRVIQSVDGGNSHAVAVATDGTVWAWGNNYYGQLGTGTNVGSPVPVQVDTSALGSSTAMRAYASDYYTSGLLASDGTLWTWGFNDGGLMGDGTVAHSNAPVRSGWTATAVEFDGIAGSGFVDHGDGTVSIVTPAHAAGAVDVVVRTRYQDLSDGPSFTTADGFVYIAPPVITTNSVDAGRVGDDYSVSLTATGEGPIVWAVTAGSLPAGLVLDAETGVISGTPTVAGTVSFTVSATNAGGSDTLVVGLTAAARPVIATPGGDDQHLLRATGSTIPWLGVGAAMLLLSVGTALFLVRRHRRLGRPAA